MAMSPPPRVQRVATNAAAPALRSRPWAVGGLRTAGCARRLEKTVARLSGVELAQANFTLRHSTSKAFKSP